MGHDQKIVRQQLSVSGGPNTFRKKWARNRRAAQKEAEIGEQLQRAADMQQAA